MPRDAIDDELIPLLNKESVASLKKYIAQFNRMHSIKGHSKLKKESLIELIMDQEHTKFQDMLLKILKNKPKKVMKSKIKKETVQKVKKVIKPKVEKKKETVKKVKKVIKPKVEKKKETVKTVKKVIKPKVEKPKVEKKNNYTDKDIFNAKISKKVFPNATKSHLTKLRNLKIRIKKAEGFKLKMLVNDFNKAVKKIDIDKKNKEESDKVEMQLKKKRKEDEEKKKVEKAKYDKKPVLEKIKGFFEKHKNESKADVIRKEVNLILKQIKKEIKSKEERKKLRQMFRKELDKINKTLKENNQKAFINQAMVIYSI
jgi:hypothetical protein